MSYRPSGHSTTFAGYPVVDWTPDMTNLEIAGTTAYAIRLDWESYDKGITWLEHFKAFINAKGVEQIPAFIIGAWGFGGMDSIDEIVEVVAASRDKLPNLKALYVGDIL